MAAKQDMGTGTASKAMLQLTIPRRGGAGGGEPAAYGIVDRTRPIGHIAGHWRGSSNRQ